MPLPSNIDRKLYSAGTDLETLLQVPPVHPPVAALGSPAIVPSNVSDGLKAEDCKAEMILCKMKEAAALALRASTAASFFNRTSLV